VSHRRKPVIAEGEYLGHYAAHPLDPRYDEPDCECAYCVETECACEDCPECAVATEEARREFDEEASADHYYDDWRRDV
jgi:hypothetical protein